MQKRFYFDSLNFLKFDKTIKILVLFLFWSCIAIGAYGSIRISGIVKDSSGDLLPGVNVIEQGTNNGVITDMDGRYSIVVSGSNSVLQFSFIGLKTENVKVGRKSIIDVVMEDESEIMDEVVVVGYGTMRRKDLSGAVASLSNDKLMEGSPISLTQALQGRLAGVQVNQSDGAPGSGASITVRGSNSFSTNSQPLYIVDGIPFDVGSTPTSGANDGNNTTANPLAMINPNDIESIDVLKDASATAIYGSRGANGVIIITTKKGKAGKAKIEFSANWGISKISRNVEMLDAYTYAQYVNEGNVNGALYDGLLITDVPYNGSWSYRADEHGNRIPDSGSYNPLPEDFLNPGWRTDEYGNREWVEGTNWMDQILQTALTQEYNVGVSGGSDKSNYAISGNYTTQDGIIRNSGYERFAFRTNVNSQITSWLSAGLNMNVTKSTTNFAKANSYDYSIIRSALIYLPTVYVGDKTEDDEYSWLSANPKTYVETAKDELSSLNVFTSAYAEMEITDWLKFRQNLGISLYNNDRGTYYNRETGEGKSANGRAGRSDNFGQNLTAESLLTFDKTFNDIHKLNVVAGFTYEKSSWGGKSITASNFTTDLTQDFDMSQALNVDRPTSNRGEAVLVSLLGRANYTLKDRYIFTASYRRDGSSRFASGNKFANFASGAFAWSLSEEDFIKSLGVFSNLKLRLSYGQTGNQAISSYQTMESLGTANYPLNGTLTGGFSGQTYKGPLNKDLKWETTDQYNVGIDLGFLDNRLNFTANYYYKKTKDLLQNVSIPTSTGYSTMWTNYGYVTNKGFEFSGNIVALNNADWTLSFDGNISFNQNKIGGLDADQYASQLWYGASEVFLQRNGYPIGTIYGYVEDGFYDNLAEVRADPIYEKVSDDEAQRMIGEIKYVDINNDGHITEDDRAIIGDTNPDFTYGFNTNLRWKNLSLGLFFQGSQGNDIFNGNLTMIGMSSIGNVTKEAYDTRWTPENTANAKWPRVTTAMTREMKLSNRYVEDGSYFRLKTINLNYNLGSVWKGITNISLFANISNVFTITNYSWFDPDVNSFGTDASRRGVDIGSYPNSRTYTFGIKLTL